MTLKINNRFKIDKIASAIFNLKEVKMNTFTRDTVRDTYKKYYLKNDNAHQIDHADDVYNLMISMNNKLDLNLDLNLILVAAYTHDMFSNVNNRKNHHKLASDYVLNSSDRCLDKLSYNDKILVANAVKEHRGSYKGEFSSKLSELISAADRGYLDFDIMYNRSLKYNKCNHNEVIKHLKEKFGSLGYAKYPDLYTDYFGEDIFIFKKVIDNL